MKEETKILDARQEARRRRRRRRRILQTCIILSVVLLLLLVGTLVVLHIIGVQQAKNGETASFLAVTGIQVEGETRYTDEELIKASGLYVGQSLFAINKAQAGETLMATFPYLSKVEVSNASFDTLQIYVEETPVMALVENADGWMVLGENNHALEFFTSDTAPTDLVRIKGAAFVSETVGETLLDERSLRIARTLLDGAKQYGLPTMHTINMTEKTNITLQVGQNLEVLLGNETNLTVQLQVLVQTLPTLYANNGEDVDGRLDMTSYADDNPNNDRAIYTPSELLTVITTTTTTGGTGDSTTDGSAAQTTTTQE